MIAHTIQCNSYTQYISHILRSSLHSWDSAAVCPLGAEICPCSLAAVTALACAVTVGTVGDNTIRSVQYVCIHNIKCLDDCDQMTNALYIFS